MFWRRSRAKQEVVEETDDLAKLQKQFGITPVNDADVQAEFQALFGAAGRSSPTEEEKLLFGAGEDDEEDEEDEEAKILRDLRLDGVTVDEEESDGHREAKIELRGVLEEVHRTARESHRREAAEMRGQESRGGGGAAAVTKEKATQVQVLKMEALALKKEGKIPEALAKFREAKQLQEKHSAQEKETKSSTGLASIMQQGKTRQNGRPPVESTGMLDDEDRDVEVTDEDMQDPEFLAQLADMGLTDDDEDSNDARDGRNHQVMQQLSALKTQIHECKVQAVQLKRQNQIADALTCMRKIKELEAKRDELQSSSMTSTQAAQKRTTPEVSESVNRPAPVNSFTLVRSNLGAVPLDENHPDSDNDSMSDVEVTPEDMSDPAFAAELLKFGGEDTASADPAQTELPTPERTATPPTLSNARSLRNAPSIDEGDLIDAFDDSDEETDHLTSVMSSGSLRSVPSIPEAETTTLSIEDVDTKTENSHVADLTAQLQKARHSALYLKRKGDIQGALEAMRRAKQIQNLIDRKQQASEIPASTMGSLQNTSSAAKFQEIEQLLVEFGNRTMMLAKENLPVNRERASEWLSKRKHYGAELEQLRQKRQNPLQPPPHYEIIRNSHQVEFELPFVPDDQIKVSVKSVNGLSQVAGKSAFVKFCLNFPSAASHEGQTAEFQISSNASFSTEIPSSHTSFDFKLARSRGTMRLFEIKKAVFEVWKPATLFRNPELVARAYHDLTPLLTCCEINTHIPFVGSNRKPCGGDIEIALQLRRPLKGKEIRLETVEDLVIGDYPEPMVSSPDHLPMPSVVLEQSPASTRSPATKEMTATNNSAVLKEGQPGPASASLDDPHHLDLIVSYDIINEELEKVGAKLPSLSGPTAVEWGDRYDSLSLKKQLLEIEMQIGKLTLDMYVERLHNRISADRVLISQLLASNRRLDAARVLHRIKVMEKELEGAEGGFKDS